MTLVAFRELTGWQHEMYECRSVDPQHRNEYENVYAESNSEKVGNPVEGERRFRWEGERFLLSAGMAPQ